MELDLFDKKILYELDLNSRAPASQIARKVRLSKETVNFRINRLVKDGYIKSFYTIINSTNLGEYYYQIFVKFINITPEIENRIINFIRSHSRCQNLRIAGGLYNIIFTISVKNPGELKDFFFVFKNKFGQYLSTHSMHVVSATHKLNQKFLHPEGSVERKSFSLEKASRKKFDELDIKILKILSTNSRIKLTELAKKLKVDPKVAKYRIKKMAENRTIVGYSVVLDFNKLGVEYIQLNLRLKNLEHVPSVIQYFDQTGKCVLAHELIGKYDLSLEMFVENNAAFDTIMNDFKRKYIGKYNYFDTSYIYKEFMT